MDIRIQLPKVLMAKMKRRAKQKKISLNQYMLDAINWFVEEYKINPNIIGGKK